MVMMVMVSNIEVLPISDLHAVEMIQAEIKGDGGDARSVCAYVCVRVCVMWVRGRA